MSVELKNGEKIKLINGDEVTVCSKLGDGGQGIVYKVKYKNNEYALKWYRPSKIKDQPSFVKNLEKNIENCAPAEAKGCFLWPLAITEISNQGNFGYIMELKPSGFVGLGQVTSAKIRPDLETRIKIALNMVRAFRSLYVNGYSYQDINSGNFFVHPVSGEIRICDNDNVSEYGMNTGIAGTPGYSAPEIVRRDAQPNAQTDKFSLAVVLFRLFFLGDPLEGKKVIKAVCLTEKAEVEHYGEHPVFIFDPNDNSNRPVHGVHKSPLILWDYYPEFFKKIFILAFCDGMLIPEKRVEFREWQKILIQLRGEILTCQCKEKELYTNFYDKKLNILCCPNCGRQFRIPLKFDTQYFSINLYPKIKLYQCHTKNALDEYENVTGTVVTNKKDNSLFGIRNLTDDIWTVTNEDGTINQYANQEVIPIRKDMQINFGDTEVTIK